MDGRVRFPHIPATYHNRTDTSHAYRDMSVLSFSTFVLSFFDPPPPSFYHLFVFVVKYGCAVILI